MGNSSAEFDFDQLIARRGTDSRKWDDIGSVFGSEAVLPLWIADMDFASPPAVAAKVLERAGHPVYAYNTRDRAAFSQAIIDWVRRRHDWNIEKEWVVQAPGVVPAIILSILALSKPGDGIIIQPPVYPPFFASIKDNQRNIVENPLISHNGYYEMDFADLEQKLANPDNKLLLLCSPHNPVGRVWTRDELDRVYQLCQTYQVDVLSDEIHSDLVYGGHKHTVFASLGTPVCHQSITFMAASKTFNIAGLNTSFIIVPCKQKRGLIETEINRMHLRRNNLFGVLATEAAYQAGEAWLDALLVYLEKNAAMLVDFMEARLPGVKVVKPEGTFLAWLDFRAYFNDAAGLSEFLVEQAQVGLNPGLAFGTQGAGFARLNFATRQSVVLEAVTRIEKAIKQLDRRGS
ncbi:MalY/PatB family protein [Sporomusa sphaeroides]|uniref:MalY/PatB family protein n=1 Tax=Sporomusa sphaeroides TaxID=47679 RepID=UPI002CD31CF2|nr:PatB family C-S lyase [Sporomusa sphaeroides]HML32244.1 PatB family C-S lyase [Sporomusa sphaeroides]